MSTKRCEDLYASYTAGYAAGKGQLPREPPAFEASLEAWARELGYLDGAASARLRAASELVRWCLCYRSYQRCVLGSSSVLEGPDECGPEDAATVELGCRLGQNDAGTSRRRSPVAIAELLRSLGG